MNFRANSLGPGEARESGAKLAKNPCKSGERTIRAGDESRGKPGSILCSVFYVRYSALPSPTTRIARRPGEFLGFASRREKEIRRMKKIQGWKAWAAARGGSPPLFPFRAVVPGG
jgi:hypothetical protein